MAIEAFSALVVKEEDNRFIRSVSKKEISALPAGELLIRVHYSSLNYKDALSASGHRGITRKYPHTPGIDASGIVEESSHPSFVKGEKVLVTGYDLGMNTSGGFGQYIRVPADWVVKLPPKLSLRESMIYGTAGFTAAIAVYELLEAGVTPAKGPVLVTGATGGVGSMSIAILTQAGFEVIAATGKEDAKDDLMQLGAKQIVPRTDILDTPQRPLLKGRWAGVIDTIGGEYLAAAIKSTHPYGAVACCGLVVSPDFNINVFPFILRGVKLIGIESAEFPMELRRRIWNQIATQWKCPDNLLDLMTIETTLEGLETKINAILKGMIKGRVLVTHSIEK
jgi:putative YhdH/YhfP family quinone oxidoreductase